MAATSSSGPNPAPKAHPIKVVNESSKKLSIFTFSSGCNVHFKRPPASKATLKRENNLTSHNLVHSVDLPTSGAGSVFGAQSKIDRMKRMKGRAATRNYDPTSQPWILETSGVAGSQTTGPNDVPPASTNKKYKGVKKGGMDSSIWYVFSQTQHGFQATPVSDWYAFTPTINYHHLTTDEAEEQMAKKNRQHNLFDVMWKKKLDNQDLKPEDIENALNMDGGAPGKKGSKFKLTEAEDWVKEEVDDDDDEVADADDFEDVADASAPPPSKKDVSAANAAKKKSKSGDVDKKSLKKKLLEAKITDGEAVEESDDGDFEQQEFDYDTPSGSAPSSPSSVEQEEEEKGVEDETGESMD